jgi:hypothetical protein
VLQLLFTANVLPSTPILVTLKMEALNSSETSVLKRATLCNIPEDGILQLTYNLCIMLKRYRGVHDLGEYLYSLLRP